MILTFGEFAEIETHSYKYTLQVILLGAEPHAVTASQAASQDVALGSIGEEGKEDVEEIDELENNANSNNNANDVSVIKTGWGAADASKEPGNNALQKQMPTHQIEAMEAQRAIGAMY